MENLTALSYELRKDVINMIRSGKAGHIGGDMSVIDTLVTLYFKQMNISPENMDDPDRDRFVMSKGHSVEALYAVLAEKGFFPIEEVIDTFSKFGSKFIGHPNNKLPGIEMNSGSLGHGLPVCVGMALAGKMNHQNYRVYTVMGDGELGMSHHSAQDIAAMAAIPNMRVYIPSDHLQTRELVKALLKDEKPAYVRVGRNAVEPVYEEEHVPFEMDKATVVCEGTDIAIIACGEMVKPAKDAAELLNAQGISASVIDMYCVKPLDAEAVVKAAENAKAVLTVEEHAPYGGLGSMVSQIVGSRCPKKVVNLSLPDAPVITGTSKEVFDYYGLNAEGIAEKAAELVK